MSTPVGLWRDANHRYYTDYPDTGKVGPIPSVTTVTGVLSKGWALDNWSREQAALAAIANLSSLPQMVKTSGEAATAKFIAAATGQRLKEASDLGSRVHALTEALDRGEDIAPNEQERPYIEGYVAWKAETGVIYSAIEDMVHSPTNGYAGTLDRIGRIDGAMLLLDVKTGRTVSYKGVIYDEIQMQLHAYSGLTAGDYIGRPGDPTRYRIPRIEGLGVIHVRPEGTKLIRFDLDMAVLDAFLLCRALHRFKERGPTVAGVAA